MASLDYSKKTMTELKELCKERAITGVSSKNKNELISLLEGKELPKKEVHTISKEDAEKSATEWMPVIKEWLVCAIQDPTQHRDIGKVLAQAAEIVGVKSLNEMSGRSSKIIVGKSYDCITEDDKPKVRAQIKFRMDAWHFETTRRNSAKNAETNGTGHIAYRNDEFDMVAIFKPSSTFGITGSTIRCIPVAALINPAKPDQLVTTISSTIRKIYDDEEKTAEVIKTLYQTLP